jgi:hypothetical protein
MRNIIVSEYVSLDGVMQDPGGVGEFEHGGWTTPYWRCDKGGDMEPQIDSPARGRSRPTPCRGPGS